MKNASPGQEEDPEHDEAHDAEAEGAVEVGPGALEAPPPAPAPATQPVPAMHCNGEVKISSRIYSKDFTFHIPSSPALMESQADRHTASYLIEEIMLLVAESR